MEINPAFRNIAIEGNIGAGKTTLAKSLADNLNAKLVLERFENNPFLADFYADKDRFALQVELFFMADRYQQLSKLTLGDIFHEHTIMDYHFAKSAIFGLLNLKADELSLFQNLYFVMERFTPKPDIIIYIHHGFERIQSQIDKRNRTFEEGIPKEYLKSLHQHYMQHFKKVDSRPVVVLDFEAASAANADFVLTKTMDVLSKDWPSGLSILSC